MSNLATMQRQFQEYLLSPDTEGTSEALQHLIVSTPAMPATLRTRIYKEAYQSRLLEALASNFPCLKRYVGDDTFTGLARDYARQYPSSYRSIRWFGHQFAAYLSSILPDEYGAVAELAEFEWSMALVFDAADAAGVTLSDMAALPPDSWGTMRFIPHPSLTQLILSWNSPALWEALNQEQAPPEGVKSDKAQSWLLWRQDYYNHFYAMDTDEAWAMTALQQGETFGDICLGLCQWHDEQEVGAFAASLLKKWVQSQMIAEISFRE